MFQKETVHIVLYGTLRQNVKGSRFNSFNLGNYLQYERDCLVRGKLLDVKHCPAFVFTNSDTFVLGELYSFIDKSILTYLDSYEGYNPKKEDESIFKRRQMVTYDPESLNTYIYVWNDRTEGYPEITSGDWAQHVARV